MQNNPPRRSKILIVDDKAANIEILNEILAADYDIYFATNGLEALKIAKKQAPDLILLDITMPGMDGYQTCLHLKADGVTRDIPVIFVTSRTTLDDEEQGLELGAVDYIAKPISPSIVKLRVRNHLELKKQRDLLEAMSALDGLTGIANRRAFDTHLAREWNRAARLKNSLCLMMCDVDHFKRFNDNYGHIAGDDCLIKVAKTIAGQMQRTTDMVARYGGEEFACVLSEVDLEGASLVADKARRAVLALQIPHGFSKTCQSISISVGAVVMIPRPELTIQQFINYSDEALYEAKNRGRNQVICRCLD